MSQCFLLLRFMACHSTCHQSTYNVCLYTSTNIDTFYRHCCQAHIKSHSYIIAGSETLLHHYTLTLKKNVVTPMKKWQKRDNKSKIPVPAHKLFFTMSTSTWSVPGAVFLKMSCPFITQARPCTQKLKSNYLDQWSSTSTVNNSVWDLTFSQQ